MTPFACLALCVALLGACRIVPTNGNGGAAEVEPDLETAIAGILDAQAAAWNAGDLDGFMSAFERSPSTTYIGAPGLVEGFEAIRARYAPGFAPGAERDLLHFESLRAREIDTRYAIVTVRYVLTRAGEVTSTGPVTLVMMNVEGTWRIVHDQSAADATQDPVSGEPSN